MHRADGFQKVTDPGRLTSRKVVTGRTRDCSETSHMGIPLSKELGKYKTVRLDSGLGFQEKVLKILSVVPSSPSHGPVPRLLYHSTLG